MALWRRFGVSGFESLIHCRKELYFPAGGVAGLRDFRALEEPFSQSSPIFCYAQFLSSMASGQVKPKPKADGKGGDWRKPVVQDDVGIRLNEEIREPEVRLVTDQGHRVVSIQEALFLARKHNLDLVEVQKKVKIEGGSHSPVFKPAVCKLMDYYKEKYKQEVKGKERAKSLTTITLRNGENKEVRFKAKTELKDLKIKADTVKRLMERGYRVKCTAMHTGKDDEDLGALLLNLLVLIEDISVVESGPHLDTKNAYVIVKHIKFTSKKGSKAGKAMETVKSALSARLVAAPDTGADKDKDDVSAEEWETVESDSESVTEGPPKQFITNTANRDDNKAETSFNTKPERSTFGGTIPIPVLRTSEQPEQSNRYSKENNGAFSANRDGVPPGRFAGGNQPPGRFAGGNQPPRRFAGGNQPPGRFDGGNQPPGRFAGGNQPPGRFAGGNQWRMKEQTGSNESRDHGQSHPRDRPARTYTPGSSPPPRLGVFKASEGSDSNAGVVTPQKYGVFSPTKSPPPVNERAKKPSSPTPSYGIFSNPRTISSQDEKKLRDRSDNGSSPSPRFGTFTPLKKA